MRARSARDVHAKHHALCLSCHPQIGAQRACSQCVGNDEQHVDLHARARSRHRGRSVAVPECGGDEERVGDSMFTRVCHATRSTSVRGSGRTRHSHTRPCHTRMPRARATHARRSSTMFRATSTSAHTATARKQPVAESTRARRPEGTPANSAGMVQHPTCVPRECHVPVDSTGRHNGSVNQAP